MPAGRSGLLGLLPPAVQPVTKAQLDNDSILILPSAHRGGWLTLTDLGKIKPQLFGLAKKLIVLFLNVGFVLSDYGFICSFRSNASMLTLYLRPSDKVTRCSGRFDPCASV